MIRRISGLAAVCLFVLPAKAVVLGQVDTFDSGPGGWGSGASVGVQPGGGPAGASDPYLQISTSTPQLHNRRLL